MRIGKLCKRCGFSHVSDFHCNFCANDKPKRACVCGNNPTIELFIEDIPTPRKGTILSIFEFVCIRCYNANHYKPHFNWKRH